MQLIHTSQRGMMLLEALLGVLIFSIGIIAMMGLQASALSNVNESKYRSEAAFLANQLIADMGSQIAVTRNNNLTSGTKMDFPVNDTAYTYDIGKTQQASRAVSSLIPTNLNPWTDRVTAALPGVSAATDSFPTVLVTPCVKGTVEPKCPTALTKHTIGKTYGQVVEVTVRWKLPNSATVRQHTASTYFAYDDLDQ